jgi:hypothetical protein
MRNVKVMRMDSKGFLDEYITRIHPAADSMNPDLAHEIAQAFLTYKFGLYENALRRCTLALESAGTSGIHRAIAHALRILQANVQARLENSATIPGEFLFDEQDREYVALLLPQESIGYEPTYLLDNALLLIYGAAFIASPSDREALSEQEQGVLLIIDGYRDELGLE